MKAYQQIRHHSACVGHLVGRCDLGALKGDWSIEGGKKATRALGLSKTVLIM